MSKLPKVLVVLSSLALGCGFLIYRSGAQERSFPGSKSMRVAPHGAAGATAAATNPATAPTTTAPADASTGTLILTTAPSTPAGGGFMIYSSKSGVVLPPKNAAQILQATPASSPATAPTSQPAAIAQPAAQQPAPKR